MPNCFRSNKNSEADNLASTVEFEGNSLPAAAFPVYIQPWEPLWRFSFDRNYLNSESSPRPNRIFQRVTLRRPPAKTAAGNCKVASDSVACSFGANPSGPSLRVRS